MNSDLRPDKQGSSCLILSASVTFVAFCELVLRSGGGSGVYRFTCSPTEVPVTG